MRLIAVSVIANLVLIIIISALIVMQHNLPNSSGGGLVDGNTISTGAKTVEFNDSELETWLGIKERLSVINTDPSFTGNRTLEWISMRNSSSAPWDNWNQKSMEWLCFWSGQGANGEWEAVVSIYNVPNSSTNFVVEVSRFTWHSLEVKLDDDIKASFPQITTDTVSAGYTTFRLTV